MLKGLLLLSVCFLVMTARCHQDTEQRGDGEAKVESDLNAVHESSLVPKSRAKRGVFWDFFQKIVTTKNLIVDQYVDTRNTFNDAYNLINEGFSDPGPVKPTSSPRDASTTKSSSEEDSDGMETTTPYVISRYEFGQILGRNIRGLQRLMQIELKDAFNQSHYNIQEYKGELQKQFANSLTVEKKKHLKRLKG